MKFFCRQTRSHNFLSFILFLLSIFTVNASNQCQPATWSKANLRRAVTTSTTTSNATTTTSSTISTAASNIASIISTGNVQPGQINCRYSASTYSDVNYYTCTQLADRYGITVQAFFTLNPELDLDCSNIQPNSEYCVAGFIEPLRATAGLCGPPNQNATCLGTAYQCCNAETWTCGNTTADCSPGTCYEGACVGENIYGTDGTCGYQYGNRLCAGVWGDCCNMNGTCGTGSAFCGTGVCQSGNCTRPAVNSTLPSWLSGNTTDGTCGGANFTTCNVVYGNCCNKDGLCGSLISDCGVGCQPQFGSCSSLSSSTTSSTAQSSSSITTTSSTKSLPQTTTTSTPSSSSITTSSTITAISSLPSCGQTCFSNMPGQYSTLGCSSPDPGCLCNNVNFGYGIRDCSNGACGTAVASTVIAFESAYCSLATQTATPTTTATGVSRVVLDDANKRA